MSKELADSIRRGSKGLHQLDRQQYAYNIRDELIGVCAIGAITVDKCKKLVRYYYPEKEEFIKWFPGVDWFTFNRICPADLMHHLCGKSITLFTLIQHLADAHKWTFEQIAEYVETLDR